MDTLACTVSAFASTLALAPRHSASSSCSVSAADTLSLGNQISLSRSFSWSLHKTAAYSSDSRFSVSQPSQSLCSLVRRHSRVHCAVAEDSNGESSLTKPTRPKEVQALAKAATVAFGTTACSAATAASSFAAPLTHIFPVYGEVSSALEASVQLLYLGALLALLGAGSFLVVRQVLVRTELENAAKELQERVRSGVASSEEYYELGAVMLRKKFFYMADKYLEQAIKKWDGDEQDLAQVHNALGFSYFSEEKLEKAVAQYQKAVQLQPGYVTAWNNLGNVYEKKEEWKEALKAYEEALAYDPTNSIAKGRVDGLRSKASTYK